MTSVKAIAVAAAVLAAAGGLGASFLASCAATPTNVPVQSFEQPQNLDVVCMQVFDGYNGNAIIPPRPQPESACAQVPSGTLGAPLPYHLYALVTQTTRGEVAVVDLTGGGIIDVDPSTPGINFLPVGRLPSDIASTPDGMMTFVGSADPSKPAIFALPSTLILGDSQSFDGGAVTPSADAIIPNLTTWPVCALQQAPGAIKVLPNRLLASADGGAAPEGPAAGYSIVAVLPGDSTHPSYVATIDPTPMLRGAAAYDYEDASALGAGPQVDAGSLTPCTIINYIPLAAPAAGATWSPGPTWDDGVKWADGGIDADIPQAATTCASPTDAGAFTGGSSPLIANTLSGATPRGGASVLDTSGPRPTLYVADTALPLIHVIDVSDPSAPVERAPLFATSVADPTRTVGVGQIAVSPTTREYKRFLYAIDQSEGSIMVYDVTDPANGPRVPLTRPHQEIQPFEPADRIIFGTPVASVQFAQHDWPLEEKYIAPNANPASLIAAETGLECNPNPSVNANDTNNPSVNNGNGVKDIYGVAIEQGPFSDDGAYYRGSGDLTDEVILGPARLRGVFAFATLANGSVVTIDVDDWDAPCRRPDPLAQRVAITGVTTSADGGINTALEAEDLFFGMFNAIAPPEPDAGPLDTDPYHVPVTFQSVYTDSPVSLEWYAPVSVPHRARSLYNLRIDPTNGNHAPYLLGTPLAFSSGTPITTQGPQAVANPSLVPTDTIYVDPSVVTNAVEPNPLDRTSTVVLDSNGQFDFAHPYLPQSYPGATPGVRFAWETPEVQIDQDWTVTYEGALPGFYDSGDDPLVIADLYPLNAKGGALVPGTDAGAGAAANYSQLWVGNVGSNYFCSKGIEDLAVGTQRATAEFEAMKANGLAPSDEWGENFEHQVTDYIQLTDNIRANADGYWAQDNTCWTTNGVTVAVENRANLCADTYSSTLDPSSPNLQRDFPIIEAHDDHLILGRFAYPGGTPVPREPGQGNWTVVADDPGNAPFLQLMQCCFANQIHFNVRTGGQWSANGSVSGFLHHIVATGSDARCAPSCQERDALLNGRSAPVPRPAAGSAGDGDGGTTCTGGTVPSITRDSVLAMRNPMFSFLVWNGLASDATGCDDNPPIRDMQWQFSTRGQFTPQSINLASSNTGLSPQSMRFIDSLGYLAIVDGSSQGLILLDLNTLQEAHPPYY